MSSSLQVFNSNLTEYSAAMAAILKNNEKARKYADTISRMNNRKMEDYARDWFNQTAAYQEEIESGSPLDLLSREDCPAVIREMCIKDAFDIGDQEYDCDEKKEKFRGKLWDYVVVLSKQSRLIVGDEETVEDPIDGVDRDDGSDFNDTMKDITEKLASILPAGFMGKIQDIAQGIHHDNITDPEELQKRVIADTMKVVTTLLSPQKFK